MISSWPLAGSLPPQPLHRPRYDGTNAGALSSDTTMLVRFAIESPCSQNRARHSASKNALLNSGSGFDVRPLVLRWAVRAPIVELFRKSAQYGERSWPDRIDVVASFQEHTDSPLG